MMHYWGSSWGWGNWFVMGAAMLIFWGLVAAVVIWLVQTAGSRSAGGRRASDVPRGEAPQSRAREILDERYARGEIGDDEYRARRDVLTAP